jgi:putative phage-type endonuclease
VERKDWLAWRKKGVGASDVPSIMGVSPYRSILDIYNDKVSDVIEEKTSYIMELGNTLEPIARSYYEIGVDADFPAANFVHATTPHYRASLDGFNEELNEAIEIKYVGKTFFEECPPKYYPQIQYQYAVTLCEKITLVQINNMNKIHHFLVERDNEYIADMLKKVDHFWQCVLDRNIDEITAMVPVKIKKEGKKRSKKNEDI